jgi:hypothetical protein
LPPPACEADDESVSPAASARTTLPDQDRSTSDMVRSDGSFAPDPVAHDRLLDLASLAESRSLAPSASTRSNAAGAVEPPPHSLAPVGHDLERRRPGASGWQIAAVLAGLVLFPVGWIAGRTVVAAAQPWLEDAPPAQAPLPPSPLQADSPLPPPTRASASTLDTEGSPSSPGNSSPPHAAAVTSAGIAASSSPPAPPASSSPVSFNQSTLTVEPPPNGIVFLNGKPVGRTGERLTTRGCGLRFVRVAQSPEERGGQGFRWLSKGQTVNLPCGGAVTIQPSGPNATPNDESTSERD